MSVVFCRTFNYKLCKGLVIKSNERFKRLFHANVHLRLLELSYNAEINPLVQCPRQRALFMDHTNYSSRACIINEGIEVFDVPRVSYTVVAASDVYFFFLQTRFHVMCAWN